MGKEGKKKEVGKRRVGGLRGGREGGGEGMERPVSFVRENISESYEPIVDS
jgi:hypothetical protein